jgi:hypothetical protein
MQMRIINKKAHWVLLLSGLLLTACNDMQQSKPTKPVTEKYTASTVLLTGKVQGTSQTVEALDGESQNVIVSAQVQEKGRYQLEVPAQTKLPIVLRSDEFISVVIDSDVTNYDINSLTTTIAARAKALGGYTRKNIVSAASDSVNAPEANKTSTGWRGDTTSQYGGWH